MSDYELDLDQILAEFNADAPETSPGERPERSESATLSRRARREAAERAAEAARRPIREEPEVLPEGDDAAPEMEDTVDEAPVRRRSRPEKKATKKTTRGRPLTPTRRRGSGIPTAAIRCWCCCAGCSLPSASAFRP